MKFGKLRIASIVLIALALIYIPLSAFIFQFAMYSNVMGILFEVLPLIFLLIHLIKFGDASSKKRWFTVALGIKFLYYLINLLLGIRGIMVDAATVSALLVNAVATLVFGFITVDSLFAFKYRKVSVVMSLIPVLYVGAYMINFLGDEKSGSVVALLSSFPQLCIQLGILLYLLSLKTAARASAMTVVEPISNGAIEETPTLVIEPMDDEELKKELDKLQWEFENGFLIEPEYEKRKAELLARK